MSGDLHKNANGLLFSFARINRRAMTEAEEMLWERLRDRKLNGFKFRRQHPIAEFIADFYCHACRLVVEVDGGYHYDQAQKASDEQRTCRLNELHIKVIRFSNTEVKENLDSVLRKIAGHLEMQRTTIGKNEDTHPDS